MKNRKNGIVQTHILVWLLSFFLFGTAQAAEPVCARVKIEIQQELTLERQAFDAMMRINNGLESLSIEDVNVAVNFTDENGNPVVATSDPNSTDPDAKFFIRIDTMDGISDVSGNGVVAPASSAEIHWLIIPIPGAADGLPGGKLYYVGATLTYSIGGETETVEVTPDFITVKPMPKLALDYFLTRQVVADDTFTPEVEPPEPYTLGVRIRNKGTGTASNVAIDSAQPKIIENEQGLLIDFTIIGSNVDDQPSQPSLLINFGDIGPAESRVGRWIMESSLSGEFVDFTATVSHADELGGAVTSLIDPNDLNTHFLIRDVRVDLPGRDFVRDFLAYPAGGTEGTLQVYESDTIDSDVANLSSSANLVLNNQSGTESFYTLTLPVQPGFVYAKLHDSSNGEKVIKSVVRSDGKVLLADNAWNSKTRNRNTNPPSWEHWLNIFDVNTTGTYIIQIGDPVEAAAAPVIQVITDKTTYEGKQVGFLVEATDPNGDAVSMTASPLPNGATFTDNGDGTAYFNWTPSNGQAGLYSITYKASDGTLESSRTAAIKVNPAWDTDGDGMDDAWELANFGSLDHDGSGDADGDGVSDLDEYLNGTDPNLPPPAVPTGIMAFAGNATNLIMWPSVDGADSYRIYWSTAPGVTKTNGTLLEVTGSPATHDGLTNGTTYYYVMSAVGAGGESAVSAEFNATPGQRDWGTPAMLEQSSGAVSEIKTALADDGSALVVWVQDDNGRKDLWGNRFLPGSGWGTPVLIDTSDAADVSQPRLVANSDGFAMVLWRENDGVGDKLWVADYSPSTGWGTPSNLTSAVAIGESAAVFRDDGSVVTVWSQGDAIEQTGSVWSSSYVMGSWTQAVRIDNTTALRVASLQLVADAGSNAMAVWTATADQQTYDITYNHLETSGWGTAQTLRSNLKGDASAPVVKIQLTMNDSGEAMLVWGEAASPNSIWSSRYTTTGGWETATLLDTSDTQGAYTPVIAMDNSGNAITAWVQSDGTNDVLYALRYVAGSGWSSAPTVLSSASRPSHVGEVSAPYVSMDSDGNAFISWQQGDGVEANVWARHYDGPSATWLPAQIIETENKGDAQQPVIAMNSSGESLIAWLQNDGQSTNLWANNFAAGNNGMPNILPVVVLPQTLEVSEQDSVQLKVSDAFDQDGNIVSYQWGQVSGGTVALSNANSMEASFTAPAVDSTQSLVFAVKVTDDQGGITEKLVTVTVNNANVLPVVKAGTDQSVPEQSTVTLSGTASDADGTIASVAWSQLSGTSVTLNGADSLNASFTAPTLKVAQTLTFRLTVTDDEGGVSSDEVAVTVNPVNHPPVVSAGSDQTVDEQSPVTLTGTASDPDADGVLKSYAWTQLSGTSVTLNGADSLNASFTAPTLKVSQTLTFRLTVADDEGGVSSSDVVVTVNPVNHPPVVSAGSDQTVDEQTPVTLTGTASDPDADGVLKSYTWIQLSGSSVILSGADSLNASFTAPTLKVSQTLTFRLTVADDEGGVSSDDVTVTVNPVNHPPVVSAGSDQTVDEQTAVTLTGTASDPDADGVLKSYAWTQINGSSVTLSGADSLSASFTAPTLKVAETLTFRLTVTDDEGGVSSDDVTVTVNPVNHPPVVSAGSDQTVDEQTAVTLTGTSSDPDADGVLKSYAWTQVSGSAVTLSGADSLGVSFTAPTLKVAQTLIFRLTVTDDEGGVSSDDVSVIVNPVNHPPVVSAGSDQTVDEQTPVILSGTASDPDDDGVLKSYAWNQLSGSSVTLSGADSLSVSFTAPTLKVAQTLTFRLTVTDDEGGVSSDDVAVTVNPVNHPPVVSAGDNMSQGENTLVTLAGLIHDPDADGVITHISWTQISGPSVSLYGADTSTATFTTPPVYEDMTLSFHLYVEDDEGGVAEDSVEVVVYSTDPDDDADGMDDLWEIHYFATLDRDGNGDLDSDGATDLMEFGFGTDPTVPQGPGQPSILSPDGTETTTLMPTLSVTNGDHHPAFNVTYEFEVYSDAAMSQQVARVTDVAEGNVTTSWMLPQNLQDNTWYYWRARALGWSLVSEWVGSSFFVNTVNDPPEPFYTSTPANGAWVDTFNPVLSVTNSTDVDEDTLTYGFTIYTYSSDPQVVTSIDGLPQGDAGSTSWTVAQSLQENTWYLWESTVTDEHGAQTTTDRASFFVNTVNDAPSEPTIFAPKADQEVWLLSVPLVVNNAIEPEGESVTYFYEFDKVNTFDSSDKRTSGPVVEQSDMTSWLASGLDDNTLYYWRVKASDGRAESAWVMGSFFTNTVNDPPSIPMPHNPGSGAWVGSLSPTLSVYPATDVDRDKLTYEYEVYSANYRWMLGDLYASSSGQDVWWQVQPQLQDAGWYYWRARAVDEHGLAGKWSELTNFYADDDGVNDTPEIKLGKIKQNNSAGNTNIVDVRWVDRDADSNATISLYADTDHRGENGVMIASGIKEDPDGQGDQYSWDTSNMQPGVYYLYAVIDDGMSSSVSYSPNAIIIGDGGGKPFISLGEATYAKGTKNQNVLLSWWDIDSNSNAHISLYYDTDDEGENGILIKSSILEDDDVKGDKYLWDISGIPEGSYYLYAVIEDGINRYVSYADNPLVIKH